MTTKTAFIGHRRIKYGPIRERLLEAVKKEIENGCKLFTMGTHGEFDKMALSVCRELRRTYKDIEIEVVITSFTALKREIEDDEWGHFESNQYDDVKTIFYDIEEEYFKKQITVSNRQMIDTCDTLICYVDKKQSPSGAKTAMNYAKRKGLKIINIYHEEDEPTFGMTEEQKKKYYDDFYKELHSKVKNKNVK